MKKLYELILLIAVAAALALGFVWAFGTLGSWSQQAQPASVEAAP